jgi:hypothetical protein
MDLAIMSSQRSVKKLLEAQQLRLYLGPELVKSAQGLTTQPVDFLRSQNRF